MRAPSAPLWRVFGDALRRAWCRLTGGHAWEPTGRVGVVAALRIVAGVDVVCARCGARRCEEAT